MRDSRAVPKPEDQRARSFAASAEVNPVEPAARPSEELSIHRQLFCRRTFDATQGWGEAHQFTLLDLGAGRRRLRSPAIDGRQALVFTLVEELAALLRGTTSSVRAGAVRRAASHAMDVLEQVDAGRAEDSEAQRAFRDVETVLSRPSIRSPAKRSR